MLRRSLLSSLKFLIALSLGAGLWLMGLIFFTHLIPFNSQDNDLFTDGIVVFTGGEARLQEALSLFERHKAKYLLVSGVNPESTFKDKIAKMPLKNQITIGYASDTIENAKETATWARANHLKSLRLITSNYHVPRSLFELRRLLPQVQIFSHAVVGESFLKPKWWLDPPTLILVIQEYNKFLFALLRRPFEDLQDFFDNGAQPL
jgi:uncharacterized SAM-binding protein YcdF (DUF218 family)